MDDLWSGTRGIFSHFHTHDDRQVVLPRYISSLLMRFLAKIGYIRRDHACVIGLEEMASIPLLAYDIFLNIFLNALFVWPILRRKLSNPRLHALAKRTCL
jgi:hypothetical protein